VDRRHRRRHAPSRVPHRLRASEADRRAYAALTHELATREWDDINDYAQAKAR
jgi:GrpB-like predicted nucleotidyltransferase (UPF0157 family)